MELQTLSAEDVLHIHNALVADFSSSNDPISPSGVRSEHLLESAISRQWTSLGGILKYDSPITSVATLVYGLCNDHPFYNGNKRTALVAMLAHLDKNKLSLFDTNQQDLYKFMLQVASHTIGLRIDKRKVKRRGSDVKRAADEEVNSIAHWVADRAGRVIRGEHPITYREMRKILETFGYYLQNPKNNSIDIVRTEEVRKGLLRKTTVMQTKRIGNIPWPGENRQMSIRDVKRVREICRLCEENGVDSEAFYNYTVVIDTFVNHYRKVLTRLAKT